MHKKLVLSFAAATLLFASCKKDKAPVTPTAPLEIPYENLTTTTSYIETFKGDDGNSSVNFSGQTTRVAMLKELETQVKIWSTTAVDANKLKNMFANSGSPFTAADLNTSGKSLVEKVAQSFSATDAETERARFRGYFDAQAAASAFRTDSAYEGHAGKLSTYLVNEKGFEYGQFIQKGMMGAMMLDQICNIYLGTDEQSADNSTNVEGTNYTALEHHWDEAYGYLTQNAYFPMKNPADSTKWLESYLGNYVRQVGDPTTVYMAFLKGRAAIVNKDDAARNAQIEFIRTSLEKAIATIAVSYLNKTIEATSAPTKFHSLSEGTGFIYALRFAYNPKISKTKSDELLNLLMGKTNGFWSLTTDDLTNVRNQVADAFGIDRTAEVNH